MGVQQRVEILKALYRSPEVLILDEPTAVLTPQETLALIDNLRSLKALGKTVIFITHKLKEVMAVADRVTVMRAGRIVLSVDIADTNPNQLAAAMVGRSLLVEGRAERVAPGQELVRLDGLACEPKAGGIGLAHVSLKLRQGEVVGIAGVEGNGQSNRSKSSQGCVPRTRVASRSRARCDSGGKSEGNASGWRRASRGSDLDRARATASLVDNLITGGHEKPPILRGLWIDRNAARAHATRRVKEFDVRPGNVDANAGSLSGGNMQKAIIARELDSDPQIIVAAHPTRGVDIGAAEFVYSQLLGRRDRAGVILVSSDLDEIQRLSDRILVMYRGAIIAEVDPEKLTAEQLGLLMAGITGDASSVSGEAA